MAGGLGGLGGFGNILGAIGQSLLTSPRENPFQGFPTALQSMSKMGEHQAALSAMATVAEKLGVPKELAASPEAMKLFIDHINTTKLNQLRQQAAQGTSFMPPAEDAAPQPNMSVPGLQGSSGVSRNFDVAGGVGSPGGGLGGLGGMAQGGGASVPRPPAFTMKGGRGGTTMALPVDPNLAPAIAKYASAAGLDPVDVATAMSYETGGTFNKWQAGPTTKWGQHRGLIQWGQPQARQYGVTKDTPVEDQVQAAIKYLQDRGVKPGMGLLDIYSAINAGGVGRYGASDRAAGGAPGTVAEKVANQMGAHRVKAERLLASVQPTQTAAADVPLPPPRPIQLASNDPNALPLPKPAIQSSADPNTLPLPKPAIQSSADPNMPLPSPAMQRVMEEARARGIGQGGADTAAGLGQSGAPLNQVAASRRLPATPIPDTNLPAAPATPPPQGTGDTKTKAWARAEFQRGMNLLAVSNGDPVLMKQAEIVLQRAAKYGDPSDVARRVSEAGLGGTPVGRAIVGGLPQSAIEALTEQQIPGYVSPSTLEQKKFRSAEEERAYQHQKGERQFESAEEQRRYQNQFGERKFSNEVGQQQYQREFGERRFSNTVAQQALEFNQREAQRQQQRDLALRSQAIAQMTPEEKVGAALNTEARAPNIRAGQEAKTAQTVAEAEARDRAAAQSKFSAEATGGAQAAEALVEPVREAQRRLENVVRMGGYGPLAANRVSRTLNAVVPDLPGLKPAHAAEVERQRFDQAIASIGAAKAALVNKAQGGGNMSATEQVLARADLPTLTAADPEVARGALNKLNEDIERAQKLDKRFGLYGGEQQAPRARDETPAQAPAAPAPAQSGWVDYGGGIRVRRKP